MKNFWIILGEIWLYIFLVVGLVGFIPAIVIAATRSNPWLIGLPPLMAVLATVGLAGIAARES